MFFILSKVISWLIMPVSLVTLPIIASLFVRRVKTKKILRTVGIGALLFFTNPLISKVLMNAWEVNPIAYADIDQTYDWCIVLGGYTEPNRPPYDRVHFTKGADRITNAIELYKLGKIKKILIAGGSGTLSFKGRAESTTIRDFVINAGVKQNDVFIEDRSRNTRENAIYCQKFLSQQASEQKVLLITSAFHMPRASGCFQEVNIEHLPFPTDYYGGPIRATPEDIIVPGLSGLKLWSILFKEWVGYMAYKFAGYI